MNIEYIEKNTDAIIEFYETITSTSERAKKIVENGNEKTSLVITENQTNGKGTNGRMWLSNKGENILMTLIFYPNNSLEELDGITYKIAEMIKLAIKDLYNISLEIKLPNDLLLNKKKICGILTETATIENKLKYLIIGIGLNVFQTVFDEEIANIATSLEKEYPNTLYKREDIIIKIFNNIKSLFKI